MFGLNILWTSQQDLWQRQYGKFFMKNSIFAWLSLKYRNYGKLVSSWASNQKLIAIYLGLLISSLSRNLIQKSPNFELNSNIKWNKKNSIVAFCNFSRLTRSPIIRIFRFQSERRKSVRELVLRWPGWKLACCLTAPASKKGFCQRTQKKS